MSELQIGGAVLVVTLIVLFSGLPIAWGLILVAVGFLLLFKGPDSLANVPILMMDELSSFALLTIPLFVLLGAAIGASAAGKDIYESLHRWLDRVPGRSRDRQHPRLRHVLGDLRIEPRHRGRDRQGRRARDDPARRIAGHGDRFDLRRRHARDPDPAVDHDDPLRPGHRNVDRPAVPGRRHARHPAGG